MDKLRTLSTLPPPLTRRLLSPESTRGAGFGVDAPPRLRPRLCRPLFSPSGCKRGVSNSERAVAPLSSSSIVGPQRALTDASLRCSASFSSSCEAALPQRRPSLLARGWIASAWAARGGRVAYPRRRRLASSVEKRRVGGVGRQVKRLRSAFSKE